VLTPQLHDAEKSADNLQGKDDFYLGMIEASLVQRTRTGAKVCLFVDGLKYNHFTLRRQPNGGYFVTSATSTSSCIKSR
jgi:hypothetical protein